MISPLEKIPMSVFIYVWVPVARGTYESMVKVWIHIVNVFYVLLVNVWCIFLCTSYVFNQKVHFLCEGLVFYSECLVAFNYEYLSFCLKFDKI